MFIAALAPWANGRAQPDFAERTFDTATAFTPQAWDRLRRLRAAYDPRGMLRAVHPVPGPAAGTEER